MNRISTNTDVLAWAAEIVEAKGEKFTALSKGEQFVIAKFITAMTADNIEPKVEETDVPYDPPPSHPSQDNGTTDDCYRCPSPQKEMPSSMPMVRAVAFSNKGLDAQQAFDKFLVWCNDHPKEREVMDFSTGSKSVAAAFAYWLGQSISVE